VNCATAYRAGNPHYLPRRQPGDNAQWLVIAARSGLTPGLAAITNGSQPTSPPQPMPAASVQQLTDSKHHDPRVTIISRYTGYFDVDAGREAPQWVGWT